MSDDKDFRLVYIEWEDSYAGTSGWGEVEGSQPSVVVCQSVGWLIYDGDKCKLIVPHLNEPDHPNVSRQGCGDMTIPTRAILKMKDLRMDQPSKHRARKKL